MKTWTMSFALCLAAGSAAAQPPPMGDPEPMPEPMPEPEPEPAPAPPPPPAQPVRPPPPVEPMVQPVDDHRPTALSIGIGLGYQLPTSLETPNVTSVRFRLPSGLTFEPLVTLTSASNETDVGTTTTDKETELELGALIRYPLSSRGRVDLEGLGAFVVGSQSTQPDVDDNDRTVTTIAASYGVAVTSWISSHWQLSLSALNPVLSSVSTSQEMGPGSEAVNTQTKFGLVWDPTVIFMVHLYH